MFSGSFTRLRASASSIISAALVLDGEVKIGKRSLPSMPTGIKVRGGEEIGKRVVISAHDKRLVNEIFFKVVQ